MNTLRICFSIIAVIIFSYRGFKYYKEYTDRYTIQNTDLDAFEGRWAASGREVYFAKMKNGLSMSVYESPKETLVRQANYFVLKNQRTFTYLEKAGGKLYFNEGDLVFDYFIDTTKKVQFKFEQKINDELQFQYSENNKKYRIAMNATKQAINFWAEYENSPIFNFRGVKLTY